MYIYGFCCFFLGQHQVPVRTGHGPELTSKPKRPTTVRRSVLFERRKWRLPQPALSGFVSELMCSGSQRIHEEMIPRMRGETAPPSQTSSTAA